MHPARKLVTKPSDSAVPETGFVPRFTITNAMTSHPPQFRGDFDHSPSGQVVDSVNDKKDFYKCFAEICHHETIAGSTWIVRHIPWLVHFHKLDPVHLCHSCR